MEDAEYCREIESYLCRKNGGHLIRIVGPAFETVCQWSEQGVPLKIVFRGIDRCVDRANAKGGRRRPLRIEFCEADVRAAFDDWRRALGVTASQVSETSGGFGEDEAVSRQGSLPAHISRSVARLLAVKNDPPDAAFDETISRVIRELDALAATAASARGDARARAIQQLAVLDADVIAAARARVDPATATALQQEADAELEAFAGRMPADGLARARELAFERVLRESFNLPVLSYE
jgi:hypothetical protein